MSEQYAEVFIVACEAFVRRYRAPLPKDVLEIGGGNPWKLRLNNSESDLEELPRFYISVEFNGWPAGLLSATGGVLAAGAAANESSLIGWLNDCRVKDAKV